MNILFLYILEVTVRLKFQNRRARAGNGSSLLALVAAVLLLLPTASAFAQGSIFGTVQNSNLTTPADGDILFFGFLDDTDEEIRIQSSDGAGYQSGNWFDDFQNYLTEAAGNPYDYYFFNTVNGETFHLAKPIPNNSFQQEDILLAPGIVPARPTNVNARGISASRMIISWSGSVGLTYHVYRRPAASNGSFFRLDNVAGSLANPGVSDTFFVDNTVDGVSSYTYLVIAQNVSANYSAPSVPVNGSSAVLTAPLVNSITPNTGPSVGGTSVTIRGNGFDAAGVTVLFGANPATAITVVNAGTITATSPAGTGTVSVVVTNTAAALSGTLLNGWSYFANIAPVANAGPDQLGQFKNTLITLNGTGSSDANGDSLRYRWAQVAGPSVTLSDTTVAQPTFTATANGDYFFRLIINDGIVNSTPDTVRVQIVERAPVLAAIGAQIVTEGNNLNFNATATDPDATTPTLSAVNLPAGATFVNNGNGTGTFNWTPGLTQSGLYNVTFVASDGVLADSELVQITVNEVGNQTPVLAAIGPRNVNEGAILNFNISATDADATIPALIAINVPANATFVDNNNGTGTFNFAPDFNQAGLFNVTFIATDGVLEDSEIVIITVNNVNRAPSLTAIAPQNTTEGLLLTFGATATDPDATIPTLTATGLPSGATFVNNLNGTGTFNWTPGFTQAGNYNVNIIASDGTLADTEIVAISVLDAGNQIPVLATIGNRSVIEGNILSFRVSATDADATIPTLSASGLPANSAFVDSANGAGSFVFAPNFNQAGVYNVTFVAGDGVAADTEIVQITVGESGNIPPVLDSIGVRQIAEGNVLTIAISASDETSPPSLLVSTLMNNYVFVDSGNGRGTFTYSPDFFDAGVDTATFFAVDDGGAIAQEKVQITTLDINRAPKISPPLADVTALPGDSVKFHVVATDSTDPNGGRLFLFALQKPAAAVFADSANNRGSLRWKPAITDTGIHRFIVLVSDDETPSLSSRDTATITVLVANQAPVLAAIGPKSVPEGQLLEFRISATDPDGTIPFFTAQSIPTNAALIDSGNGAGSFRFTPNFTQSGLYSVKIIASDGNKTDNEVVLIQVTNVPQPPILTVPADTQRTTEGQLLSFRISATDPDGTIPSLSLSDIVPPPVNAVFVDSGNGAGSFRFTPQFVEAGIYDLYFIATDGARSDTELVVMEVLDAGNQPPVLTVRRGTTTLNDGDSTSVTEGNSISIAISTTDADSVLPVLSSSALPVGINPSTFVDNGDGTGTFSWQTLNLDVGNYPLTFYATDGTDNGIVDSSRVIVKVVDFNVIPNPILYEPFFACTNPSSCAGTIAEGATQTFRFYSLDGDNTDPIMTAKPFTVSGTDTTILFASNLPINMTVTDVGDTGVFLFQPNFQQAGTYRVMMLAIDQNYPTVYVKSPWTITVNNVSVPPILNAIGNLSVVEGNTLDVVITGSDPDGLPVTISSSGLPAGATLTALGGQPSGQAQSRLLYTPGFTAAGTYNVTFRVKENATVLADSEIVVLTVIEAGPQPPKFVDLNPSYQIVANLQTLRLWLRSSDPDSPTPVLSHVGNPTLPVNGVFVDSANGRGSYTFAPTLAQGNQTFNVRFFATSGGAADTMDVALNVILGMCGDADNNSQISVSDAVYIVNYIFGGGPAPATQPGGDPDGNGQTSIADAVYLINYIFAGGPPPNCN